MEWTPAKLRYLLMFHSLAEEKNTVRCIDLAINLGISRASVSRMLGQFEDDGILQASGRSGYTLTELGREESDRYYQQFELLYKLFHQQLKLPDFEARECAASLITSLPSALSAELQQKCRQYLESLPPQA